MTGFIKRQRVSLSALGFTMIGIGWSLIGVMIDSPAHQFYGVAMVGGLVVGMGFYVSCRERY
jgi:hypothetical protein